MTGSANDGWHFIGKHAVRFEPPDLVFTRPDGDMSLEQHLQLLNFVKSLPRPERGFFAIIDVEKGGRSDPAALKMPEILEHGKNHQAIAYFNAKFFHRTVIGIFQRASKLLKLGPIDIPMRIFDTEAEARAWIDEFRKQARDH